MSQLAGSSSAVPKYTASRGAAAQRYRQDLYCGKPPLLAPGQYRHTPKFGSMCAHWAGYADKKFEKDLATLTKLFATGSNGEPVSVEQMKRMVFASLYCITAGRQMETEFGALCEPVEMCVSLADFKGTHADEQYNMKGSNMMHVYPLPDIGSNADNPGWSGKARQTAENTHHLPVVNIARESIYTDNYSAIAARLDMLMRATQYVDGNLRPMIFVAKENLEEADDLLYKLQMKGGLKEYALIYMEALKTAIFDHMTHFHGREFNPDPKSLPLSVDSGTSYRSKTRNSGAALSGWQCMRHHIMEINVCAQQMHFEWLHALMWWFDVNVENTSDATGESDDPFEDDKRIVMKDHNHAAKMDDMTARHYLINSRACRVTAGGFLIPEPHKIDDDYSVHIAELEATPLLTVDRQPINGEQVRRRDEWNAGEEDDELPPSASMAGSVGRAESAEKW